VTSQGSQTRIRWEGDSLSVIRDFPASVRANLGNDLQRLEEGLAPLDFGSMGKVLPGVYELRDQDSQRWFRVFYVPMGGMIFVLHCFTKTTNRTLQRDIEIGRARLSSLKQRLAEQKRVGHDERKKR